VLAQATLLPGTVWQQATLLCKHDQSKAGCQIMVSSTRHANGCKPPANGPCHVVTVSNTPHPARLGMLQHMPARQKRRELCTQLGARNVCTAVGARKSDKDTLRSGTRGGGHPSLL
jgi:hypothetical protein